LPGGHDVDCPVGSTGQLSVHVCVSLRLNKTQVERFSVHRSGFESPERLAYMDWSSIAVIPPFHPMGEIGDPGCSSL
jgi:hypothetical protein